MEETDPMLKEQGFKYRKWNFIMEQIKVHISEFILHSLLFYLVKNNYL